jgi:hypothetical protein
MNVLSAWIKCSSIAFLVGLLTSAGPNLGNQILPLVGAMAFIIALLVLFELTNLEPATTVLAPALKTAAVHL